jgi:futalosine hydrolase
VIFLGFAEARTPLVSVIFPTAFEMEPFVGLMKRPQAFSAVRREGFRGKVAGLDVEVLVCGAGQANTAQTVAALLESRLPGLIVLGGVAGAFRQSGLAIGDIAMATGEVYADIGVQTSDGRLGLSEISLPLVEMAGGRFFEEFPVNSPAAALGWAADDNVRAGLFATVSTVTGTAVEADRIWEKFGALCENMEGAAAAQVALVYGAPFTEIRGISNMVEDRNRENWDLPLAAGRSASAVAGMLARYALENI